jgi:hypothetical protein
LRERLFLTRQQIAFAKVQQVLKQSTGLFRHRRCAVSRSSKPAALRLAGTFSGVGHEGASDQEDPAMNFVANHGRV